jgi:acetyl esterase/lipase
LLIVIVVVGLFTKVGQYLLGEINQFSLVESTQITEMPTEADTSEMITENVISKIEISAEEITTEVIMESTTETTTEERIPYEGQLVFSNLSYGLNESNTYDLYMPSGINMKESQGLILMVHGGSWVSGKKEDMAEHCIRLSDKGYITATMNYTLCTNHGTACVETMLDEISVCILEIKRKVESLGISVNNMAITGTSAGGHLALLYAYRRADVAAIPIRFVFQQVAPIDFHAETWSLGMSELTMFNDQSRYLHFLNMISGKTHTLDQLMNGELEDDIMALSPCSYIDDNSVPTILSYGKHDVTIGNLHQDFLLDKLDEYGVPYDYILFENSGHLLNKDPDKLEELYDTVMEYAETYFVTEE